MLIPVKDIWFDDEFNTRDGVTPASVVTLAESIEQQGQLQPIRVQEQVNSERGTRYKCIMGHRRGAAFKLLARNDPKRWEMIDAVVHDGPVSDSDALIMNLLENLERKELNMLEEAKAIARFKEMKWDVAKIASKLRQPKAWVQARLDLLKMSSEIQERAAQNFLSQYQVIKAWEMPTEEERNEYIRKIVDNKMRGLTLDGKIKAAKQKRKNQIAIFTQGTQRTQADMFLVQEAIQDSFRNNAHPAAVALAWAGGVISWETFKSRVDEWAAEEGVEFILPEELQS